MLRVKIGRPETLQEAINLAKRTECEVELQSELVRKNTEVKYATQNDNEKGPKKNNSQNRFRPYNATGRTRNFSAKPNGNHNNEGESSQQSGDSNNKRCYNSRNAPAISVMKSATYLRSAAQINLIQIKFN